MDPIIKTMREKEAIYNKNFPSNSNNGRQVCRRSDAPIVQQEKLAKLRTYAVCSQAPGCFDGLVQKVVVRERVYTGDGQSFMPEQKGYQLIPLMDLPLTKVFTVSYGGGRVYGGGTSTEALRRAKRKARLNGSR